MKTGGAQPRSYIHRVEMINKNQKIKHMKSTITKLTIALVIISSLASCSRYSSPYPEGHPCIKERRPNIFRH